MKLQTVLALKSNLDLRPSLFSRNRSSNRNRSKRITHMNQLHGAPDQRHHARDKVDHSDDKVRGTHDQGTTAEDPVHDAPTRCTTQV